MAPDTDRSDSEKVDNKVARLIDEYGLGEQFGERLEELWTADGDERESLRALANRFNKRLLEAAMVDAGLATVDGEVTNLYRLLTSNEVSSGDQIEVQNRLERDGVDVEQLERDFVTYQAIRSYLKGFRGIEYDQKKETTRTDSVILTIQRLRSRTRSVAEKNLGQLKRTGRIALGEFRIFIDISILCEDCNTQYELVEFLREGSCECQSE